MNDWAKAALFILMYVPILIVWYGISYLLGNKTAEGIFWIVDKIEEKVAERK